MSDAFDRVAGELALIRYRPGWRFEAQDLGERIAIVLEPPPLPDSHGGSEPVQIRMTRYIEHDGDPFATAWELVRCMEMHEAGEWFVVDGNRPHDPHKLPDGLQCEGIA